VKIALLCHNVAPPLMKNNRCFTLDTPMLNAKSSENLLCTDQNWRNFGGLEDMVVMTTLADWPHRWLGRCLYSVRTKEDPRDDTLPAGCSVWRDDTRSHELISASRMLPLLSATDAECELMNRGERIYTVSQTRNSARPTDQRASYASTPSRPTRALGLSIHIRHILPSSKNGPKMAQFLLYALTLPNINRLSKLFHCQNQKKICNNTVTTDPTTPQVCCYSTLRNVSVIKATIEKRRLL